MIISDSAIRASKHLSKLGSKTLSDLINRCGPIDIPTRYDDDPLMGMCQIVVSQQLSNQAAKSIWGKICDTFPDRSVRIYNLKNQKSTDLGLSNAKKRTLQILLEHGEEWLKIQMGKPDHLRYDALTSLWGIGHWSVSMWELFVLKKPDIWADGDLILKRTSEHLANDAGEARLDWINCAAPYRSFLALYCWELNNC